MDKIAKAIVGAVCAAALAYITAAADGLLTGEELGYVITAALGTFGFVWGVPNAGTTVAKR